ncbi:FAD-binding oxidoreductase [Rhodobacteraceae bacterium KMM 6894]|nr:FAD-binding oxidoreductase [Rhodobacteraceae bacterium KMM 6894]
MAISFERMNKIIRLDPLQGVAIVQAGVRLQDLIDAAGEYGMRPGVDLPSRGSCTMGGMASTNAGGIQAIRYGMMRDNILGLKAVLADGEILDLTNVLVKNNAGYDLKHLFIGSEGTLGLITELVVKLHPAPLSKETALIGCPDVECLADLLKLARARLGSQLLSFEAMWPTYLRAIAGPSDAGLDLLRHDHAVFGILETGNWQVEQSTSTLQALLEEAFEAGLVTDAVLAQSEGQRAAIWRLREDSDVIAARHEACLTYDIGLELADIPAYADKLRQRFRSEFPSVEIYLFGHMGDGNLHVMLGGSAQDIACRAPLDEAVYGSLTAFSNTTVSAEHGIGIEKRPFLHLSRTPDAIKTMRFLKRAFDPQGTLNPGKLL